MCCWGLCFLPQAQAQVFDGILHFNASVLESTCLLSIAMESSGDRLGNGLTKKLDFFVNNNNACSKKKLFQLSIDGPENKFSLIDETLFLRITDKEGIVTALSINFIGFPEAEGFSLGTLEIGGSKKNPQLRSNTPPLKMGSIPLSQNGNSSIVVRSENTNKADLPLLVDYK